MNERRDRGRTLHRVRQPRVQQELCRFAHRAHEQEQADKGEGIDVPAKKMNGLAGQRRGLSKYGVKIDGSRHHEHGEDAKRKSEVADTVDNKGLDGGSIRLGLLIPKSDE